MIFTFVYTNYKGVISVRTIKPANIWYGISKYHAGEQWFLTGYDVQKGEFRDFAMRDIKEIR